MAAATKPNAQLIAVDTNVLIDRADDNDIVIECLRTIRKRIPSAQIVVSPTVIQELSDISDEDSHPAKDLAFKALSCLLSWGFQPINFIPAGHGIVERDGQTLRDKGLIPEDEVNDSFIVVEAALMGATMLVSSDQHICDIDQTSLKLELASLDIGTPIIASPRRIVRDFSR